MSVWALLVANEIPPLGILKVSRRDCSSDVVDWISLVIKGSSLKPLLGLSYARPWPNLKDLLENKFKGLSNKEVELPKSA